MDNEGSGTCGAIDLPDASPGAWRQAEISSVEEAHTERPRRSAAFPTLPPSKLQSPHKIAGVSGLTNPAAPVQNATPINTATPSEDGAKTRTCVRERERDTDLDDSRWV